MLSVTNLAERMGLTQSNIPNILSAFTAMGCMGLRPYRDKLDSTASLHDYDRRKAV